MILLPSLVLPLFLLIPLAPKPDIPLAKHTLRELLTPSNSSYFKTVTYKEMENLISYLNDQGIRKAYPIFEVALPEKYKILGTRALLYNYITEPELSPTVDKILNLHTNYAQAKHLLLHYLKDPKKYKSKITQLRQMMREYVAKVKPLRRSLWKQVLYYKELIIHNCLYGGITNKDPRVRLVCSDVIRRLVPTKEVKNVLQNILYQRTDTTTNEYYYLSLVGWYKLSVPKKEFKILVDFVRRRILAHRLLNGDNRFYLTLTPTQLRIFTKPILKNPPEGYANIPFYKNVFNSYQQFDHYVSAAILAIRSSNKKARKVGFKYLTFLLKSEPIEEEYKIKILKHLLLIPWARDKLIKDLILDDEKSALKEYTKGDKTEYAKLLRRLKEERVAYLLNSDYILHLVLKRFHELNGIVPAIKPLPYDLYDQPDLQDLKSIETPIMPVSFSKIYTSLPEYKRIEIIKPFTLGDLDFIYEF